jgi:hypothetical protein
LNKRSENLTTDATGYVKDAFINIDRLGFDLMECQAQILQRPPHAWLAIVTKMEVAAGQIWDRLSPQDKTHELDNTHCDILSRLDFNKAKLEGIESYARTTMERLIVQRGLVQSLSSLRESRLKLEITGQQRLLAVAAKRDGQSTKTLALLGAVFLPGTYLASVLSMTFFDFQNG